MKWRMRFGYAIQTIQKRYGLFLLNFAVLALCFYITDMLVTHDLTIAKQAGRIISIVDGKIVNDTKC